MDWMCEHCFPEAVEIGLLAPGLSLILEGDTYQLLWGQGHKGDVLLTFDKVPRPDPDPEIPDNRFAEDDAACIAWIEEAQEELEEKLAMHAADGYAFVLTCQESGYGTGKHPLLTQWLYDQCGGLACSRLHAAYEQL